jgi:hypothetical protein
MVARDMRVAKDERTRMTSLARAGRRAPGRRRLAALATILAPFAVPLAGASRRPGSRMESFRQGLREAGCVDGQSAAVD